MSIELGDPLPTFSCPATSGKVITSSELLGRKLVLYFYPRDSTPGCTQEGLDFKALYPEFIAAGAEILGISRDSIKSHENFRSKQDFPFELISDHEENLSNAFDVIKNKNMYGKQVRGIERSTFLFDGNGILKRAWRKLSIKGHATEVLEAVRALD